ncbi:MAG: hypothetical protein OXP69_18235 [Spirochaetaceae bacterium]|nr:hypothetical protein [Spirochaetaceae bacterium]
MQTFRKLREQDCYYMDKTPYIERLLLHSRRRASHWEPHAARSVGFFVPLIALL